MCYVVKYQSDLSDNIKRRYFRGTVESIAIFNTSWRQHLKNSQLDRYNTDISTILRKRGMSFEGHC